MNNPAIRKQLALLCTRDEKAVYLKDELRTLFQKTNENTFNRALRTFVSEGTLQRLHKGVYCYAERRRIPADRVIGQAVAALRHGHLNYLSLESALSAYGILSQIPFRMTFMTTGRSGVVDCALGVFEFTHTKRAAQDILQSIYPHEDYWRATPQTALRDLRRVGRNLHLVDEKALQNILNAHHAQPPTLGDTHA